MRRVISAVRAWRVGAGSVRHSGVGAALPPLPVANRLNCCVPLRRSCRSCRWRRMDFSPILVVRGPCCSQNGSIRRCELNRAAADRRRIEQCPQRLKRGDIRLRKRLNPHRRANRPIEHPNRQFQQSTGRAVVMAAADHFARRLLDHLMNMNDASCPRMPRIKDLALFGPMGVASSRCTIAVGRMRALTERRLTRPTSTRCPSAWQPNHGRGSTYRGGKSVQTTGTTSHQTKLAPGL